MVSLSPFSFFTKMAKLQTAKTKEIKWEEKHINIDLGRVDFMLDALQHEIIKKYMRDDRNFLRAFYTNWSGLFDQYLKDKVRIGEPVSLSVIGQTRGGKSTSAITIAGKLMEAQGRLMDTEHIVDSQWTFLEALKNPKVTHFGDCFVIDEDKQAMYGVGSTAKRVKLMDIQNIIAVNNISTIWLRPDQFAYEGANYGLRVFGRGQYYTDGTKLPVRINRFMLYNLQESTSGGMLPLGMVYLPHFEDYLKNGKELWQEYSQKKQDWVDREQQGKADNLQENMFKTAEKIFNFPKFQALKGSQRKMFIATALGSEATQGEVNSIYQIVKLIEQGFTISDIRNAFSGNK